MEILEAIDWLNENTNEWTLEVNGHTSSYETREDYVKWNDLHEWDESFNEGPNLYRVQVYHNTPIGCYVLFGTDLQKLLNEAVDTVKPHRLDGSKPMRFDAESRSK